MPPPSVAGDGAPVVLIELPRAPYDEYSKISSDGAALTPGNAADPRRRWPGTLSCSALVTLVNDVPMPAHTPVSNIGNPQVLFPLV